MLGFRVSVYDDDIDESNNNSDDIENHNYGKTTKIAMTVWWRC